MSRGEPRRVLRRHIGFAVLALLACGRPAAERRPVILLMLDTLRADHLAFYGYERDTSPHLDAFARENLAFAHAFTASPWTPPSVATLLTGLYPSSHGFMPPNSHQDALEAFTRLSPDLETLPEVLRRHGYRTAAISPNPWISTRFGFGQGFETFEFRHAMRANEIVSAGMAAVQRLAQTGDPFFLYLHFLDPHKPYEPPATYREMFPPRLKRPGHPYGEETLSAIARYDGEIRYLDDQLGLFFSFLKQQGLYDKAIIAVVADHGEQFHEHGRKYHGNALHNEEVHVPFFIRDLRSGRSAEIVADVVSTVDLFPTLLGQLRIRPPSRQRAGVSVFDRDLLARREGVLTEIYRVTDQRALIGRDLRKAIFEVPLVTRDRERKRARLWEAPRLVGLFDFKADYFERQPLEAAIPRLSAQVRGAFAQAATLRTKGPAIPAGEMSEEALEQLRSLGYLQ